MRLFLPFFFMLSLTVTGYTAPLSLIHWTTKKGTPVTFYQAMDVPMVILKIAFEAGSAYDGPDFGLSALTTELLNQGNHGLSNQTISQRLAATGSQYQAETTRDAIILSLKSLNTSPQLRSSVEVMSTILSAPDFPKEAVERQKNQQYQVLLQRQDHIDQIADEAFYAALYQHHPYAHPIDGTPKTLQAINRSTIQAFYKKYFTARNATLVLVGALSVDEAKALAEDLLHDLPEGQHASPLPPPTPLNKPKTLYIQHQSTQTAIRIGQLGINYQSPEYFPLLVGNYILGGGTLLSLLSHQLREEHGLTYGIYSQFASQRVAGPFIIQTSTQAKQHHQVKTIIFKTLNDFIHAGPQPETLAAAKQYLAGSFPVSLASNESIARLLLTLRFYQLPLDYLSNYIKHIEAVSAADIQHAFSKQLPSHRWMTVEVGPHE